MLPQLLCCRLHLVADNGQHHSLFLEFGKRVHDTWIRTGGVKAMLHIVLTENGERLIKARVALSVGYRPRHEHANAIAYEATHVIYAVLGHTARAQRIVGTCRKVRKSVEQRAVKVENNSLCHNN